MSIYFYITVIVANFILVLMGRKNKIIAYSSFILLLLIYAGNIRKGWCDLTRYRAWYENGSYGYADGYYKALEPGYVLFSSFFHRIGIPFNVYLGIVFTLCTLLVISFARRFTDDFSPIVLFSSLFYYFYNMEVIRFFIASSIIIFATGFLIEKKKKWFVIFILLAATFQHYSLVFLAMLLLSDNVNILKLCKGVAVFSLTLVAVIFVMGNKFSLGINIIQSVLGSSYAEYTNYSVKLGFLVFLFYQLVNFILILYSRYIVKSEINYISYNEKLNQFCDYSFCAVLLMFSVIPFTQIHQVFFRFIFTYNLMAYTVYAAVQQYYTEYIRKGSKAISLKILIGRLLGVCLLLMQAMIWWHFKMNILGLEETLKQSIFY